MNMNMKNEKTMLALIVVAALAMVSVAGVALASDQSDAATASTDINGSMTINTADLGDIFVYESGTDNWDSVITVPSSVTYSGSISYGYRTGSGTTVDPYVYTTVSSITLTDACDMEITVKTSVGVTTMSVLGGSDVTVELTKGSVYVDGSISVPFNGEIKSSDLDAVLVNTYGLTFTYGTVSTVSGTVNYGAVPTNWTSASGAFSSLTLSGTGYYGDLTIVSDYSGGVKLLIADGATYSNDVSHPTGTVEIDAYTGTTWAYGVAVGSDGSVYRGTVSTTALTFTDIDLSQQYTIVGMYLEATSTTTLFQYVGNMTFTASSTSLGTYAVALSDNTIASTATITNVTLASQITAVGTPASLNSSLLVVDVGSTVGTGEITYAANSSTALSVKSGITPAYAINVTTGEIATCSSGAITFAHSLSSGDMILVQLTESSTYYYYGSVTVGSTGYITAMGTSKTLTVADTENANTQTSGKVSYKISTLDTLLIGKTDVMIGAYNLDDSTSTSTSSSGIITFSKNIDDADSVVVLFQYGTTLYLYNGSITVTQNGGSASSTGIFGTTGTANSLTYYSSGYTFVSAIAFDNTTAAIQGTVSSAGVIAFDGNIASGFEVYVLLKDNSGDYYRFYGTVTVSNHIVMSLTADGTHTNNSAIEVLASTETLTGESQIQLNSSSTSISVTGSSVVITNNNLLVVDGTLNVYYAGANNLGSINNTYNIDVSGMIAYQVVNAGSAPLTCSSATIQINAAAYKVTATSPAAYTYYYTTLETAMANASDITIYGTIDILEDTVLTGNSTTTPISNKITIAAYSEIVVGATSTSAVLTLPSTTNLSFIGTIDVTNGKFIVEDVSINDYTTSQVDAEVLVTSTEKTYTDVATALSEASSGDTVKLRQAATIKSDATVSSGVTLDGNGNGVIVNADGSLVVDGIVKNVTTVTVNGADSTGTTVKAAGVLTLNATTFNYTGTFTLSGVLTFGSNYDNTADTATAFGAITIVAVDDEEPAIININGDVKIGSAMAVTSTDYVILNVYGELIATADLFSNTTEEVNVEGTFLSKAATTIDNIVVGDGASVSSYNAASTITVLNMTVGNAPKSTTQYDSGAIVKVTLNATSKSIVYGLINDDIVITTPSASTYKTTYYLETEIVYATAYGPNTVYIASINEPVIEGKVFYGWYYSASLADGKEILPASTLDKYSSVYGKLVIQTISVKLEYTQNGTWVVNGTPYNSGNVPIEWASTYSISFIANNGYELNDYAVYVNGSAMPIGYEPSAGDVISFNGTVTEKVTPKDTAMDITTILLIVITIVVVIMAIIIALKLMRS